LLPFGPDNFVALCQPAGFVESASKHSLFAELAPMPVKPTRLKNDG
jgi:hypothetical protein